MSFSRSDDSTGSVETFGKERSLVTDLHTLPVYRKILILCILCTTFFVDTTNTTILFTVTPTISKEIHISTDESPWLYAAYQATLASFLLIAGRLTDLYNPRYIFLTGSILLCIFSLSGGFIKSEIPLIIFRALMGASASLTIPSAQSLTIYLFVDPVTQAKALGMFGAMAGLGSVSGLVIGSLFVEFVTWHWVFFFSAIMSGIISITFIILVPNVKRAESGSSTHMERILRIKRIDIIGVSLVAAAQMLFILSMTSSDGHGWGSAQVIAPLILSIFLFIGFFVWETYVPEDLAAIPPKTWKYTNVTLLIITSMVPYVFWGNVYPLFSWYWQTFFDWSPVKVSLHALPVAVGCIPPVALTTVMVPKIGPKPVMIVGFVLLVAGGLFLPFNNSPSRYWAIGFPGFLLCTFGASIIYMTSNIALFATTPPAMAGVISSLFLGVAQTASAASLAVATSIQTSVQKGTGFNGTEAALWFITGVFIAAAVVFLVFVKDTGPINVPSEIQLVENKEYTAASTSRLDIAGLNNLEEYDSLMSTSHPFLPEDYHGNT